MDPHVERAPSVAGRGSHNPSFSTGTLPTTDSDVAQQQHRLSAVTEGSEGGDDNGDEHVQEALGHGRSTDAPTAEQVLALQEAGASSFVCVCVSECVSV